MIQKELNEHVRIFSISTSFSNKNDIECNVLNQMQENQIRAYFYPYLKQSVSNDQNNINSYSMFFIKIFDYNSNYTYMYINGH